MSPNYNFLIWSGSNIDFVEVISWAKYMLNIFSPLWVPLPPFRLNIKFSCCATWFHFVTHHSSVFSLFILSSFTVFSRLLSISEVKHQIELLWETFYHQRCVLSVAACSLEDSTGNRWYKIFVPLFYLGIVFVVTAESNWGIRNSSVNEDQPTIYFCLSCCSCCRKI